jgi:hypothetical protein
MLAEALFEAGVIQRDELVSRLVIDIPVADRVLIYVERYGDERLLKVAPSLSGIQIEGVPAEKVADR